MAHAFTVTTLIDTTNFAKLHVYINGDSGDATEINTSDTDVVFDASELTGDFHAARILSIEGALDGFSVLLSFDGSTPFPAVLLPKDTDFCFNGQKNLPYNNASTPNGDIVMETNGLASSANNGWFTISVRKAD